MDLFARILRRPFYLGLLASFGLGLSNSYATYNPQRAGFTAIQPTSYLRIGSSAFLGPATAGSGSWFWAIPSTRRWCLNDRGFNLSNGTVRSFDQVSPVDLKQSAMIAPPGILPKPTSLQPARLITKGVAMVRVIPDTECSSRWLRRGRFVTTPGSVISERVKLL